jgi:hypothetical protein
MSISPSQCALYLKKDPDERYILLSGRAYLWPNPFSPCRLDTDHGLLVAHGPHETGVVRWGYLIPWIHTSVSLIGTLMMVPDVLGSVQVAIAMHTHLVC